MASDIAQEVKHQMLNDFEDLTPIYYIRNAAGQTLFRFHIFRRFPIGPDVTGAIHHHVDTGLALIRSGRGKLYAGERVYPLSAGDLVLIHSMEPHYFWADPGEGPMDIIYVSLQLTQIISQVSEYIDMRLMGAFLSGSDIFGNLFDRDQPRVRQIARLMEQMAFEMSRESPACNVAKAQFLSILALLSDMLATGDRSGSFLHAEYAGAMGEMIEFIAQHLTEDLTLTRLAHHAAMETSLFSAAFKAIHGISPWNYVLHARIELAMKYLRDQQNSHSITEIAGLCGFRNLSNFNRIFKGKTGMTPSEFKRVHQ